MTELARIRQIIAIVHETPRAALPFLWQSGRDRVDGSPQLVSVGVRCGSMRIALTHNLRLTDSVDEAEFDLPETIDELAESLASGGHDVERIEVSGPASRLVARLEAYAPDLIFNSAEGRRGKMRRGFYPAPFAQPRGPAAGSPPPPPLATPRKRPPPKALAA